MKKTAITIIIISTLILSCCNGKINIEYPPVYNEVMEELENKNYKSVIDILDNTKIKMLQKTDWYYYAYGISLYNIEPTFNVRNAISHLKVASTFKPENYEYLYYLGQMHYEINEKEKAVEYFKKACLSENEAKEIPNNFNAYLWTIYLLEQEENIEEAMQVLENNKEYKESLGYKFYSEYLNGKEPFELASKISEDKDISIYGKSLYLNTLFHNSNKYNEPQKYKEFCEVEREKASDMKDYFNIQLIYFYLADEGTDKCMKHLKSFCKEIGPNIFILDSFFALRQLYFNKYKSFYYWVLKDNVKVHNEVGTFQRKKNRPLEHEMVYSEDLGEFYKEFENDSDFIHLNKYK